MARFWQKSLHDNVIISNDNTTDGQSPVGEPEKARLSQSLKAEQNHPLTPRPMAGKKKILGYTCPKTLLCECSAAWAFLYYNWLEARKNKNYSQKRVMFDRIGFVPAVGMPGEGGDNEPGWDNSWPAHDCAGPA